MYWNDTHNIHQFHGGWPILESMELPQVTLFINSYHKFFPTLLPKNGEIFEN